MRTDELDMKRILRGTYMSPRRVLARRIGFMVVWTSLWLYALIAHGPLDAAAVTLGGLCIFAMNVHFSRRKKP